MNRFLMVAFHFPPAHGSSGVLRALKTSNYIAEFGWEAVVLTVGTAALPRTDPGLAEQVPASRIVVRAPCIDVARHLAIRGRYLTRLALPDRWASWSVLGVPLGRWAIRKYRPSAIWSTYPIATAHGIAERLARSTGLPWVADFRDPMCDDGYPPDPRQFRAYRRIEERVMRHAAMATFTAPGALRTYAGRYSARSPDSLVLLPNGYDEADFAGLETTRSRVPSDPITLLHSGLLYPSERDPSHLFRALTELLCERRISEDSLRIVLRAPGHVDLYRAWIERAGLTRLVEMRPPTSYRNALAEMMNADGLLLLQAANCDGQIPAKTYEYLRAGRPLVALTTPDGDTARLLASAGIRPIAPLDDTAAIKRELPLALERIRSGTAAVPDPRVTAACSRRSQASALAEILDGITGRHRRATPDRISQIRT